MVTTSRYLEAPRRLRAFVRAHETSLVAAGGADRSHRRTGGGRDERRGRRTARGCCSTSNWGDRLSSQFRIEPLRALLVPSLGGLLLGMAFLLLLRWRPAREIDPIEANALHGGRMSFRGSVIVALQTIWSSGVGASVGLEAGYTQLASGLAASLGRGFHLRRADQRIMVGCGAAAAIAGAFGAPLAGAFYAFELVIGGYTPASLTPVGVAAVAGYFVAHAFHAAVARRRRRPGRRRTGARPCDRSAARDSRRRCSASPSCAAWRCARRCCRRPALWPPLRPALGGLAVGLLALADAAGDVVGAWRAAFCRICLDPADGRRDHVRAEGDRLDRLARQRLSRRIVLRHAVPRRARRPSVRRPAST